MSFDPVFSASPMKQASSPVKRPAGYPMNIISLLYSAQALFRRSVTELCKPTHVLSSPPVCITPCSAMKDRQQVEFPGQLRNDFSVNITNAYGFFYIRVQLWWTTKSNDIRHKDGIEASLTKTLREVTAFLQLRFYFNDLSLLGVVMSTNVECFCSNSFLKEYIFKLAYKWMMFHEVSFYILSFG